jgi:hypothetical protein
MWASNLLAVHWERRREVFLNSKAFAAAVICTSLLIGSASGQVVLEANVGQRPEPLKRIIDFFPYTETSSDFRALKPRYIVRYGGGDNGNLRSVKRAGFEPVGSFHHMTSESKIRGYVSQGRDDGVSHYIIWTEPNRTWPEENEWLAGSSWEEFCEHSVRMHDAARAGDPNCLLSGPCMTTDPRDSEVWDRLLYFLRYWDERGKKLDYVNMHPPFEPDDVTLFSNYARGFAAGSDLGIKGISIGEYPYYQDGLALHVRFFVAFEEAFNCMFAAKSNWKDNCCNTGVIDGSGNKKPVYWLFHTYARMEGMRIATTKGGANNHVQALASYDADKRKLHMLVGCYGREGEGKDETIVVTVKNVAGSATVRVHEFTSNGLRELADRTEQASNDIMPISLGTVANGDARYVTVDFSSDQTLAASVNQLRIHQRPTRRLRVRLSGADRTRMQGYEPPAEAYSLNGRLLRRLDVDHGAQSLPGAGASGILLFEAATKPQ